MRRSFAQWWIDFAERRMQTAQGVGDKRARKWGDKSLPWKMAICQEIFWRKAQWWV